MVDRGGRTTYTVYDALTNITDYAYDENANQVSMLDANGHTTTFDYDNMGRRVKRTLPAGQIETYQYDAVGNMTNKVDFNGRSIAYTYDIMNRLLSKSSIIDPQSSISYAYDAVGLRTNMTDASGANTYVYDTRDRLLAKTTPQGALTYTYDAQGNLASLQSLASHTSLLTYAYDPLNRLKSVIDQATGMTLYDYDKVGNLQDYIYPNGVSHAYQYDALNRLTNMGANLIFSNIASYAYALNQSGHRTNVVEKGGRSVSYNYDNLYRLTKETVAGSIIAGTITYEYDPVGNRTNRNSGLGNILTKVYGYDDNDRLLSDTYDANGNTVAATLDPPTFTNATAFTYGYDFENRIIAATSATEVISITYDGDGARVRKTTTPNIGSPVTTTFLVDDRNPSGYSQVLEELTHGTETTSVHYAYGLDLISETRITTNVTTHFYGYDGHGNVRFLTDEGGAITDTYDYDAFGSLINRTGSTLNNYLYCGEQFDQDLGLYFLRARYLDPDRGRFWTMDAWQGSSQDPVSLHKFLYANSNPVMMSDPSGNMTLVEIAVVSAVIGSMATTYDLLLYRRGQVTPMEVLTAFAKGAAWGLGFGLIAGVSTTAGVLIGVVALPYQAVLVGEAVIGKNYGLAAYRALLFGFAFRGISGAIASEFAAAGPVAPPAGQPPPTVQPPSGGLGNIGGGSAAADTILSAAQKWLGPSYKQIAPGVFRSADGSRQFRITTSDLTDPKGPHAHFEAICKDGCTILENSHVGIEGN